VYPGVWVKEQADKPAVVLAETGEQVTYGELEERSVRLAHVLHDTGLRRGDAIALITDNTPRAFEVYWAALRSGLYITAVNTHLTPDEAAYIVRDCGAKVVVVSAALRPMAEALVPLTPEVQLRLAYGGEVSDHSSYDEALAKGSPVPFADQPSGADMLYSSGTTGRPKGIRAPLPDRQVGEPGNTVVAVFGMLYGFDTETVYLSPAPIYHAAPLRFCAAIQSLGGTVVLMKKFDPEQALANIQKHRVTHSQWVPTMFVRMLKLPQDVREKYDVSSLKVAVHAAAPCPVDVKHKMIEWWGPVLQEYYSSTEGAGATFISSEQWLAHPGSVGQAAVGIIHICDDEGVELPVGQIGTVFFEQEQMPFSYYNDPEKTKAAQHPEHPNWTTMGDVGYVDGEGFLYLTDRKSFMIISGGVNIYPQEVEDALTLHPAVLDVAVIGIPDEVMGEQVKAVVEAAPGHTPGPELAEELTAFLRQHIAGYKVPRSIDFTEQLPRTPTGKLLKRVLRDGYQAQASA
jgi:long-chain acyl-CoA synthetase